VKRDLEPCRPKDTKEANIAKEVVAVGDGVVCGEGCKIGYEEEIEEQFNTVGFMALREDKGIVIGTHEWRLDPWCGVMEALQMLLLVTIGWLVWKLGQDRREQVWKHTHRAGIY
jgi:hypothetical protein